MSKAKKVFRNILNKKRELYYLTILIFLIFFSGYLYLFDKILPNVYVSNFDLGLKTKKESYSIINKSFTLPEKITLTTNNQVFELSLIDIDAKINFQKTIDKAFFAKRGNYLLGSVFRKPLKKEAINPVIEFDQNKLSEYLSVLSTETSIESKPPKVNYKDGEVVVDKGLPGEILDKEGFIALLSTQLSQQNFSNIEIPFKKTGTVLTDEEAQFFQKRGEVLVEKNISLTLDGNVLKTLKENELFTFLKGTGGYDEEEILEFINSKITTLVNREPQNAVFSFENGNVREFIPSKDGLSVENFRLNEKILSALKELENNDDEKTVSVEIPVSRTKAEITTANVNDLGINELIGKGSSTFRGSISARIHNISLASSKFNSVLIPPGETISFNKTLGDVSTFTGYQQAYVIKDGRTVLGDGGGVCQVSTTLFRAALDAGLPIVERRAHSYRVGYYEQDSGPGLDATVYDPTTDLKFKNDTPAHILIQTIFNSRNSSLSFEIYGTNDGRVSLITKPVVLSSTPPPEDLYVDDPTLPLGQIKQIDYKAWGAKVSFDYEVTRGGETIYEETFYSNYRPWQAVYLKGTLVQ